MKFRIKIFISILSSFISMNILLVVLPYPTNNNLIPGKSLKVTLSKDGDSYDFKKIEVSNMNPSDLKINYYNNFHTLHIRGEKTDLYNGKFLSTAYIYPPRLKSGDDKASAPLMVALSDITFYLPIFKNATEISIVDSSDKQVARMPFNYQNYSIDTAYKSQCGNGLCEFNENIIMCHKDCINSKN